MVFGLSCALLILLLIFTLSVWAASNLLGEIFAALAGHTDFGGFALGKFLSDFVGSPMFYIYLADLIALLGSAAILIFTGKH